MFPGVRFYVELARAPWLPYVCLAAMVWAIARSQKRWWTALWMLVSWVTVSVAVQVFGIIVLGADGGQALAAMFATPSLLVPAGVGILHSNRVTSSP